MSPLLLPLSYRPVEILSDSQLISSPTGRGRAENPDVPIKVCRVCSKRLKGRQRLFCGRTCKNRSTNLRCQVYKRQQRKGVARKSRLIAAAGGACEKCGYGRNSAALTFHHRDPALKNFGLDLRSLSNRSWHDIVREARLCQLLCANCHAEIHHPGAMRNTAEAQEPQPPGGSIMLCE